jgi:hypothetical protein
MKGNDGTHSLKLRGASAGSELNLPIGGKFHSYSSFLPQDF